MLLQPKTCSSQELPVKLANSQHLIMQVPLLAPIRHNLPLSLSPSLGYSPLAWSMMTGCRYSRCAASGHMATQAGSAQHNSCFKCPTFQSPLFNLGQMVHCLPSPSLSPIFLFPTHELGWACWADMSPKELAKARNRGGLRHPLGSRSCLMH